MADEITLDAPETRLERFLAAAAGMDGITLDEPETRIEKYLYKIAQGSGGVPAVEDADKGKYLHANESTGDLEWAAAGGGGGSVLEVGVTFDSGAATCDKTAGEMWEAYPNLAFVIEAGSSILKCPCVSASNSSSLYSFNAMIEGDATSFVAPSADEYPRLVEE